MDSIYEALTKLQSSVQRQEAEEIALRGKVTHLRAVEAALEDEWRKQAHELQQTNILQRRSHIATELMETEVNVLRRILREVGEKNRQNIEALKRIEESATECAREKIAPLLPLGIPLEAEREKTSSREKAETEASSVSASIAVASSRLLGLNRELESLEADFLRAKEGAKGAIAQHQSVQLQLQTAQADRMTASLALAQARKRPRESS